MTQGMIPREIIDEILDRTDIVALIESYLTLKRQGRNMVGLCPFHLEDTPSFSVSPDKQMFYCFGCQKGGNAITFVMEYEHLSFTEALEKLANRAGVTLPKREMSEGQKKVYDEKRRLKEINKAAAVFFRKQLLQSADAQAYLKKRGLSKEMIESFALGYAGDHWDHLKNELQKQGFREEDMLSAGVLSQSGNGRCYDRFRNRLMFPICDKKGDFIAFGGRVLDDALPKYLNTPETAVFHKGKNLYGLHLAYSAIRREGEAILLEGNVDVITAHQFGLDNAVAPLGTAFTEDHAKILKRYSDRVIVAFDGDGAGQRATDKALDILINVGMRPYALTLPAPRDPDDFLRSEGIEAWKKLREKALTYMDFKIRRAMNEFDAQSAEGKADILSSLGPALIKVKNQVERSEYIREISEILDIDEELVRNDVRRKLSEGRSDFGRDLDLGGERGSRGVELARKSVLYYAAEHRQTFEEIEKATHWDFLTDAAEKAVVRVIRLRKEEYSWKFRDLVDLAAEEDQALIYHFIMDDPYDLVSDKDSMFKDCWRTLRKDSLLKQKESLRRQIKESEKSGNNEDINVLLRKFAEIQQELRKI